MNQRVYVVQASSTSWSGAPDLCMSSLDGQSVAYWTLSRILGHDHHARVVLAAPEFDSGGALDNLPSLFPQGSVSVYYGHDASPLDRFLDITGDMHEDDYIVRVDGMHCFFDVAGAQSILLQATESGADCVKFPDGFPVGFASDVYRVGALRRFAALDAVRRGTEHRVHPKYFMFRQPGLFVCDYAAALPQYTSEYLQNCRTKAQSIYLEREGGQGNRRQPSGDGHSFRYTVASHYLLPPMKVLDCACGWGYGTRQLAAVCQEVHGVDLDAATIAHCQTDPANPTNVSFRVGDATALPFGPDSFDAVVSIETLEHVDGPAFLGSAHRVLRPRGRLVLSTPQNIIGHIPLNPHHRIEYSLEGLRAVLASGSFEVETILGQKGGCVLFEDDPTGCTSIAVCRKV